MWATKVHRRLGTMMLRMTCVISFYYGNSYTHCPKSSAPSLRGCEETRRFYTETLLHTAAFTHRHFYTETLLHTETFTHRRFYTQTLDTFTHRRFYTQTLLHTEAFTHRRVYTQKLLHSVFDIKHMMASSSSADVCRHFTSEVSRVWFTASWYRSFLGHLCGIFHNKMK